MNPLLQTGTAASEKHGEAKHAQRCPDKHSEHESNHRRLLMTSSTASASRRHTMMSRNMHETTSTTAPIQTGAQGEDRIVI
jgi:hypothetical protein